MGLFLVTGTMGGGKSYFAAELARDTWKAGGIVHSNIPWNVEELQKHGWHEKHIKLPEDHLEWARYETGPDGKKRLASDVLVGGAEGRENVVIVDEAALILHSMDQLENKKRNRSLFELVVMSRQLGLDVYFISQSAANIDVAIRNVMEQEIRCVNLRRVPLWGPIMTGPLKPFFGDFRRNYLSQKGRELTHSYANYSGDIGALYNTHGVGDTINIKRQVTAAAKTGVPLKAWGMLAGCALPLVYAVYTASTEKWKLKADEQPAQELGRTIRDMPAGAAQVHDAPKAATLPRLVAEIGGALWVDEFGRTFSLSGLEGLKVLTSSREGDVLKLQTPSQEILLHVTR